MAETNRFEQAAGVAREQRERLEAAAETRRLEWERALTERRAAAQASRLALQRQVSLTRAYEDLPDHEATAQGRPVEQIFDETSARTLADFLGFMKQRNFPGVDRLASLRKISDDDEAELPWVGAGYSVPFSKQGLYLCTDGQLRGSYAIGIVDRVQPERQALDLEKMGGNFATATPHRWNHLYTRYYQIPGDDMAKTFEEPASEPVSGRLVRIYKRANALQVLTRYALHADAEGEDVQSLSSMMPELTQPTMRVRLGEIVGHPNYKHETDLLWDKSEKDSHDILGTPIADPPEWIQYWLDRE